MATDDEGLIDDIEAICAASRRNALLLTLSLLLFGGLAALWVLQDTDLAPDNVDAVWIAAMRDPARVSPAPADYIELHRLGCFEACPIYQVRISGSGVATFSGDEFVCTNRSSSVQVDREAVARMFAALDAVEFAAMPHYTREDWTDDETAVIVVSIGSSRHEVRHYYGDVSAPHVLHRIEHSIDFLAATARWIGDARCASRGASGATVQKRTPKLG